MSQILTFVYVMILFLSIFLVAAEVDWSKYFFSFFSCVPSFIRLSYTIFCHVLLTISYYFFSLQYIIYVTLTPIVLNIGPSFLFTSALITYVIVFQSCRQTQKSTKTPSRGELFIVIANKCGILNLMIE